METREDVGFVSPCLTPPSLHFLIMAATNRKPAPMATTLPSDAIDLISGFLTNPEIFNGLALCVEPNDGIKKDLALYLATEYLSLPDLTSFSRASKSCRGSITTKAVLYAAVSKTGDRFNTQKSMEHLYDLTCAEKIHVPSPLRTLAIATGNKCEFCTGSQNTIHDWSFGTFSCWECIQSRSQNLSKAWNLKWARYRQNPRKYDMVFNHSRNGVSRLYGKKYYIWAEHREAAGELIGPVIAFEDIDGMVRKMGSAVTQEESIQKMNEYIEETLSVPTPQQYAEFTSAYVAVKEDLQRFQEQKEARKAEKKRQREAAKQAKEERKRQREAQQEARKQEQEERKSQRRSTRQQVPETNNADNDNVAGEPGNAADSNSNDPDANNAAHADAPQE
jgi:hypothetical protein